jgi:hypothetical protein
MGVGRTGGKPKWAKPIAELATMAGVSAPTLRTHIEKGCPMPKTVRWLTKWLVDYHEWKKENIGTFQQEQAISARKTRSDERSKHDSEYAQWRAAKLKLDVGERTRTLVNRKDVVELAGKAVLTVRARLNAMVTKMTARLANVPDHVVSEELQDEVDAICNAFAGGMTKTFGGIEAGAPCPFCKEDNG